MARTTFCNKMDIFAYPGNYYELFLLMSPSHPAGGAGVGAAAEARGVPPVLDAVRRGGGVQAHDQQEWALHQSWPTNTHKCLLGWC